jgi:GAF domain-containing protein
VSVPGRLMTVALAPRSPARRVEAWVLAVLGPAAFALVSLPFRSTIGLRGVVFCALLVAVAVAVIGGVRQALTALVLGGLLGAFFDARPYETLRLSHADDIATLVLFVTVGGVLAFLADQLVRLIREQAALRRVATLVARGAPAAELFAAATEEVGRVLAVEVAHLDRFEPGGSVSVLAAWSVEGDHLPPVGARWPLGGENLITRISETCRPARIDSYADASGPAGVAAREAGHRSAVGAPIVVDGRLWGAMAVVSLLERPLPADTEVRLAAFTEMLAAAIADAESRADLARLAERQAALRRVATLVASAAGADELFAAVTEEIGRLPQVEIAHLARYEPDGAVTFLAGWSDAVHVPPPDGTRMDLEGENLVTLVAQAGSAARIDCDDDGSSPVGELFRESGVRCGVGTPVVVEGRVWGLLCVGSGGDQPLPCDTEVRLADFAKLLATAIANAANRSDLARLAEEQSALRRVATLVARGAPPGDLFVAVTEEVGRLLPVEFAGMGRYESDGRVTFVSTWSREGPSDFQVDSRFALGGNNLSTVVAKTCSAARIDWDDDASGPVGEVFRESGVRCGVGTPIVVDGRLWGLIVAGSTAVDSLPADLELRLGSFTELVATAVANAESRAGLARLADEQAALRRVATLVARGAPPAELFAAVTEEVAHLLPVDRAALSHYDSDGTLAVLSAWSPADSGPEPVRVNGNGNGSHLVSHEAIAGDVGEQVGTPIVVEGRPWGVMSAGSVRDEPLPPDTEARLASFTDLLATAIANAHSRAELAGLADEQAALRRVATLVARGVPSRELFAAVTEEAGRVLAVDVAAMCRYEPEGAVTLLAAWSGVDGTFPEIASRFPLESENVMTLVARTGRPARIDDLGDDSTAIGVATRDAGLRSVVATPIVVEDRLWGMISAGSASDVPLPPDIEARLAAFTDLLATAIANADSRAELAASRSRIIAAADDTRRRIERDLHDGAQQRLVALGLELRAAQAAMPPGLDNLNGELDHVADGLTRVQQLLREIARGIHPAILAHGGLGPVMKTVARQSPIPVRLDVRGLVRLSERVEVAAYYVVSEALTNAAKHSAASVVDVEVAADDGCLRLHVRDDGTGGADPTKGSGLVGLKDRVETLGGSITVDSRPGTGTSLLVEIPLGDLPPDPLCSDRG